MSERVQEIAECLALEEWTDYEVKHMRGDLRFLLARLATAEQERDAAVSDLERERPITEGYLPCREALARAEQVVEAARAVDAAADLGSPPGKLMVACRALNRALATHTQEVSDGGEER